MSVPFMGEIRIFGGNFAPRDWAFCHGQLLKIVDNTALFSLLGTTYGGDGRTTFGLPELRGAAPLHPGHGAGLSNYRQGQRGGVAEVALTDTEMPSHKHTAVGVDTAPSSNAPAGKYVGRAINRNDSKYQNTDAGLVPFKELSSTGGGKGHNNMQPYQAMQYIIAMQGVYPSRN